MYPTILKIQKVTTYNQVINLSYIQFFSIKQVFSDIYGACFTLESRYLWLHYVR